MFSGAAGAIGGATAALLAARGATLACVVRRDPEPSALPAGALILKADVTREDEVRQAVGETVRRLGRIDVFVNNAGIEGPQATLADYDAADFMRVIETNVLGVFLGLKHVMPVMTAQGSGAIVNLSSIAGVIGAPRMGGYIASKHAVQGLTKVAALEGAPHGVRVNAIQPGFIESRMLSDIATGLGGEAAGLSERVPAGRLGRPEEVAQAIAFLASDEARYMSGSSLLLDGGLTLAP